MGIGAKDFIDRLLVEKYSKEQVDNHDNDALESKISADDMLKAMNTTANSYRNMLELNARLTTVCYSVVARNAKYVKTSEAA